MNSLVTDDIIRAEAKQTKELDRHYERIFNGWSMTRQHYALDDYISTPTTSQYLIDITNRLTEWTSNISSDQILTYVVKHERSKVPKNKRIKTKRLTDLATKDATDFYREKMIKPQSWRISPFIQRPQDRAHNEAQLQNVADYATLYLQKPRMFSKDRTLGDPKDLLKDQFVTLAGSISMIRGFEIQDFEWNSKSLNNTFYALNERQFGAY